MRRTLTWSATGAVAAMMVLAGCGTSSEGDTVASAQANNVQAGSSDICVPFPAGDVPADPKPPYSPPYGDPQQPASLVALQQAVLAEAQKPEYSKDAALCAEGGQQVEVCNVAYWNVGQTPGKEEDCNFLYLRVGDQYWKGLTPMILSQLHGYLGVTADGHDLPNQTAGPHTTVAEPGGSWVNIGNKNQAVATFALTNNALDATNATSQVQAAIKDQPATSGSSFAPPISPILGAGNSSSNPAMQVDCSQVWLSTDLSTEVPVDKVPTTEGTRFFCSGTGSGIGTAYLEVTLQSPDASGNIPAAISVRAPSDQSSTLTTKPGTYDLSSVVWPVALPEVTQGTAMPFTVSTEDICYNQTTKTSDSSCLHLWVNGYSGQSDEQTLRDQGLTLGTDLQGSSDLVCTIWVTMEIQSPALTGSDGVMQKYGLDTTNYTPHISLAKKKWYKDDYAKLGGRNPCQDALNLSQGQPGADAFDPNFDPDSV